MKRFSILAAGVIFAVLAAFYTLFHEAAIRNPPDWPSDIVQKANPVTGNIRVIDAVNNKTIFSYSDDPEYYPVHPERGETGEWVVSFKMKDQ